MFGLSLRCARQVAAAVKQFHTSPIVRIDPSKVEEVRIPVPWGHIAGKWWGDQSVQPVIAGHGLLDNAGSFDLLVPKLDVKSVLCLDWPGHGLSAHAPLGQSLFFYENIYLLRYLLKNYFKWNNVTLLGHSTGSSYFFTYAGIYPDDVDKMINIDCARVVNGDNQDRSYISAKRTMNQLAKMRDVPNDEFHKIYSCEEIINKMFESRAKLKLGISKHSVRVLCKRGTVNVGKGQYKFTHDRRLYYLAFSRNTYQFYDTLCARIKCKVLNITAIDGIHIGRALNRIEHNVVTMKQKCKKIEHVEIKGGHHVHLDEPDKVVPVLNAFLADSVEVP